MEITIRPLTAADYPAVAKIYEEGIVTGNATFETKAPTWESWDKAHLSFCRFVAEKNENATEKTILAWAALVSVSDRCVYGGIAEQSVYVGEQARGLGIGRLLLLQLIQASEDSGIWTLQAGIFVENESSIALHEKMGFRRIGFRERVGQMPDGRWRDTLLFERRSKIVGI